ncbi:MAG: hypothetical protein DDG59_00315 [Anaerolineae bacterium]|jgi:hypothetical protein|nr:MAG: hypothetical protein DDG59_00315 [Anaerolineae bacterium]
MLKKCPLLILLIGLLLFTINLPGLAQTYRFSIPKEIVHAYWNEDGSLSLQYEIWFANSPSADPIDFVDIGIPTRYYDLNAVQAYVNGIPITSIEKSPYVTNGVALGLGTNAIRPGETGVVTVFIPNIQQVLYVDSSDASYVSAVFSPTWFGSEYVSGLTNLTVVFHLPKGVLPEEPRWHQSPSSFPSEPQTGLDSEGRIFYSWNNPQASASTQYKFGASFPKHYVPETAIVAQSINLDAVMEILFTLICAAIPLLFVILIIYSIVKAQRRKLEYLPPKIAIEGNGIKRGLTAVEAAILLEQPLDKVLTMILFSVLKKGAARVTNKNPLEIVRETEAEIEKLRPYELKFLEAFEISDKKKRQEALQQMIIELVKSVQNKMRGFSRKETVAYYREIVKRAWQQVEDAATPEVKSEKFDQALEWTMLDKDYDDRTRRVFESGPVYVPTWWHRYDPLFPSRPVSIPSTSSPSAPQTPTYTSAPRLPGADFAASIVNGVQNLSGSVIGNLSDFTSKITNKTNPPPAPSTSRSYRSSSGGCACACACACAGCACACAGGGR